jgi:hypothetical protein
MGDIPAESRSVRCFPPKANAGKYEDCPQGVSKVRALKVFDV